MAGIAAYLIDTASGAVAERVVAGLLARFHQAAAFPEAGARRDHVRAGLRVVIRHPYVACYVVTSSEVVIVRVLHGSRDVETLADEGGFGP